MNVDDYDDDDDDGSHPVFDCPHLASHARLQVVSFTIIRDIMIVDYNLFPIERFIVSNEMWSSV